MMIETERLLLREYTMDDFDALYEIMSDMESGELCPVWIWIMGGCVERNRGIHRGLRHYNTEY